MTYLFKGNPKGSSGPPYTCTGLVYSSYPADGSTINNLTYYVYDAVIAMAHAIDAVTNHGTSFPSSYRTPQMRDALLQNVSFEGVTGRVSFSQGLGGYQNYGAGNRRTGALYKIVNYQLCSDSGGAQTVCQRTVGHIHSEKGHLPCDRRDTANCSPVMYNTPSNTKPLDWPDPEVVYLPSSSISILWVFISLLLILVLVFGTMVYIYLGTDVIRAGQAHMLYFLLFGATLGVGRIINATYPPTDGHCIISVWLSHLCFGIVFGVLVSKTWRVHLLLGNNFQKIATTSAYVNNVALGCLLFLVVYLILLTVVSSPHRVYNATYSGNRTYLTGRCVLRHTGLSTALILLEALTVCLGMYLCWLTRGAIRIVNANKRSMYGAGAHLYINTNVMLAIYMVLLVGVVELAATYLITLSLASLVLVDNAGFFISLLAALLAIFVPKAMALTSTTCKGEMEGDALGGEAEAVEGARLKRRRPRKNSALSSLYRWSIASSLPSAAASPRSCPPEDTCPCPGTTATNREGDAFSPSASAARSLLSNEEVLEALNRQETNTHGGNRDSTCNGDRGRKFFLLANSSSSVEEENEDVHRDCPDKIVRFCSLSSKMA
eukprot:gene618-676_t